MTKIKKTLENLDKVMILYFTKRNIRFQIITTVGIIIFGIIVILNSEKMISIRNIGIIILIILFILVDIYAIKKRKF